MYYWLFVGNCHSIVSLFSTYMLNVPLVSSPLPIGISNFCITPERLSQYTRHSSSFDEPFSKMYISNFIYYHSLKQSPKWCRFILIEKYKFFFNSIVCNMHLSNLYLLFTGMNNFYVQAITTYLQIKTTLVWNKSSLNKTICF